MMATLNEYDVQAEGFLNRFGMRFGAKRIGEVYGFPFDEERDDNPHFKYQLSLTRVDSGKCFTFIFYDSTSNYYNGEQPTAYDALVTLNLDSYVYEDFNDFCGELGYDEDSRKAYSLWKRVDKFSRRIAKFLTEEELEALREIN